jgi:hypothetical protein
VVPMILTALAHLLGQAQGIVSGVTALLGGVV